MPEFKSVKEVFDKCLLDNLIKSKTDIDTDKIQSIFKIVEEYIESGKDDLTKERWNSAYCSYYDVLRELTEAFLLFDKIKILNHQCLFAYLCTKHPELELDWNFFEKHKNFKRNFWLPKKYEYNFFRGIRTKRNGINYYGTPVDDKDWKEIELQLYLYVKLLKRKIKEKLKQE